MTSTLSGWASDTKFDTVGGKGLVVGTYTDCAIMYSDLMRCAICTLIL